jgi:hypothetical protein
MEVGSSVGGGAGEEMVVGSGSTTGDGDEAADCAGDVPQAERMNARMINSP